MAPEERVQRGGLAGAGAAGDDHRRPRGHAAGEEVGELARQRAAADQLGQREALAAKAADREARAGEGERRNHHVHPRAVGQAGVAERGGLVDPASEWGEDPLDRVHQLGLGPEADPGPLEAPAPLDVDRPRTVHHHLVDRRVGEQRLERPEPGGEQDHPLRQGGPLGLRKGRRLAFDERAHLLVELAALGSARARALDQAAAERDGELLEGLHTARSRWSRRFAPGAMRRRR
jgi:hypothetical protein